MRSNQVWFYKVGLGGENTVNQKGWRLKTLGSILLQAHDLNSVTDVLKSTLRAANGIASVLCSMRACCIMFGS